MTFYIFVYFLVFVVAFLDVVNITPSRRKYALYLLIIVLVLFRGLRWRTGTDWLQFETCFNICSWDTIASYDRYGDGRERMEMGYVFVNWLVKQFGNYTLFLLVSNAFMLCTWAFLSIKFVPRYANMTFALIMVSNMVFPVRLQLAASIFCWCLYFIINKRFLLSLLFFIVTCLFHKATLILCPILLFSSIRVSDKKAFAFILISQIGGWVSGIFSSYMVLLAIALSVYYPDLAVNMAMYSENTISGYQEKSFLYTLVSFLFSLFLLFVLVWGRRVLQKSNVQVNDKKYSLRVYNICFNCFLLFTFIYKFFSDESLSNLTRMSEFFTCGYAISLMLAYKYLRFKIKPRILFFFFVLLYLYKLKIQLATPYVDEFYPYYSIFDFPMRPLRLL